MEVQKSMGSDGNDFGVDGKDMEVQNDMGAQNGMGVDGNGMGVQNGMEVDRNGVQNSMGVQNGMGVNGMVGECKMVWEWVGMVWEFRLEKECEWYGS